MDFLHTFEPAAIAFAIGPLTIYWYGIIMALAMAVGILVACALAPRYGIEREAILDAAFWLIIGGVIGARLYDVWLELPYYLNHPSEIVAVWNGGLAIHGGMIGGAVALLIFTAKRGYDRWKFMAVVAPALALGQAIGRWGNWFNQELFGRPTGSWIGIPIAPSNRPSGFGAFEFFHPTFLYESLGCLAIFSSLYFLARRKVSPPAITAVFCIDYGILRFLLEFIKIDTTPVLLGLRWPQIASLCLILVGIVILIISGHKKRAKIPSSLEMSQTF